MPWVEEAPPGAPAITDGDGLIIGYAGSRYVWKDDAPASFAGQADPYTGVIVPEDVAALPGASSSASAPIASTLGKLAPAGLGALLKNALAGDVQPIPTTAAEFSSLNAQQWLALGLMGAAAIGAVYLVTNE